MIEINPYDLLKENIWLDGHSANQDQNFLGIGMLYFAIPYMLKAKICLCLGSGGLFVPRCMRAAQRIYNQQGKTILIDNASRRWAGKGYCYPWVDPDGALRQGWPDITIIQMDTDKALNIVLSEYRYADYIHIDADHSRAGCTADWNNYSGLLTSTGVVTIHDAIGIAGVRETVQDIAQSEDWSVAIINAGSGLAVIARKL